MHLDLNKGPDGYYITLTGPEPATYFYPVLKDALAELKVLVRAQVLKLDMKTERVELRIHKAAVDDIRTLLGEGGMEKWLKTMGLSGAPGDQEGVA